MENTSINPLVKHFRQPAIWLTLPSKGQYWPSDALDLPASGQIPIYPMTTREEIIIRTPDALMNGEGVVSVIQNCCPSIKDAWKMPSIDVDAVLIAIRIASYGTEMDVDSTCPNCKAENNHQIDLNYVLDRVKTPDYTERLQVDDMHLQLKPQAYFDVNRRNRIMFEEQRILNTVTDDSLSEEEKVLRYNQYLRNLVDLNMSLLATSTDSIETAEGLLVDSQEFILEYYNNAPGHVIRSIQKRLEEYSQVAELPRLTVECDECNNTHEVKMEFDYANFFAPGSSR